MIRSAFGDNESSPQQSDVEQNDHETADNACFFNNYRENAVGMGQWQTGELGGGLPNTNPEPATFDDRFKCPADMI